MGEQSERWSRREFLGRAAAAGAAGLLGIGLGQVARDLLRQPLTALAADPPPETTTIRLIRPPGVCTAPVFVAEEFLRAEGFVDIQYIKKALGSQNTQALASGEGQLGMGTAPLFVTRVDAGDHVTFLAGVHVGCFELFGTRRVRAIHDLRGRTVAVPWLGSGAHLFLASMLAYTGLDPRDINWVVHPFPETMRLLAEERIDAYLAFPPEPQALRAAKIGHVIVNTMMDRPWSEYFCCMVIANRAFARLHPVATKRALRAVLRAADMCAREPERVAHFLVDKGYAQDYSYALEAIQQIPYDRWRDYDPENTLRFYSLRLREVGMVKSTPQKIIAQGADWHFLDELKRELKRSELRSQDHLSSIFRPSLGG